MATLNFNVNSVEDTPNDYDLLPAGWYNAIITDEEMRETKAGTGHYLNLRLDLHGNPEYDGRVVWAMLNLDHPNPKAVEIARSDLKAILVAIGKEDIKDSAELLNQHVQIKVAVQAAKDGYDAKNVVKGYKASTNAPGPTPAASAPARKPWENAA